MASFRLALSRVILMYFNDRVPLILYSLFIYLTKINNFHIFAREEELVKLDCSVTGKGFILQQNL